VKLPAVVAGGAKALRHEEVEPAVALRADTMPAFRVRTQSRMSKLCIGSSLTRA
jgi:hypothetical protein